MREGRAHMSIGHVVCGNENCGGIMLNIWHNCSPGYAFMLRDYFLWLLAIDQAPPTTTTYSSTTNSSEWPSVIKARRCRLLYKGIKIIPSSTPQTKKEDPDHFFVGFVSQPLLLVSRFARFFFSLFRWIFQAN